MYIIVEEDVIFREMRVHMIVRIWHGKVPISKAEAYREFLIKRAVPDYESVEGNEDIYILERLEVMSRIFSYFHFGRIWMRLKNLLVKM